MRVEKESLQTPVGDNDVIAALANLNIKPTDGDKVDDGVLPRGPTGGIPSFVPAGPLGSYLPPGSTRYAQSFRNGNRRNIDDNEQQPLKYIKPGGHQCAEWPVDFNSHTNMGQSINDYSGQQICKRSTANLPANHLHTLSTFSSEDISFELPNGSGDTDFVDKLLEEIDEGNNKRRSDISDSGIESATGSPISDQQVPSPGNLSQQTLTLSSSETLYHHSRSDSYKHILISDQVPNNSDDSGTLTNPLNDPVYEDYFEDVLQVIEKDAGDLGKNQQVRLAASQQGATQLINQATAGTQYFQADGLHLSQASTVRPTVGQCHMTNAPTVLNQQTTFVTQRQSSSQSSFAVQQLPACPTTSVSSSRHNIPPNIAVPESALPESLLPGLQSESGGRKDLPYTYCTLPQMTAELSGPSLMYPSSNKQFAPTTSQHGEQGTAYAPLQMPVFSAASIQNIYSRIAEHSQAVVTSRTSGTIIRPHVVPITSVQHTQHSRIGLMPGTNVCQTATNGNQVMPGTNTLHNGMNILHSSSAGQTLVTPVTGISQHLLAGMQMTPGTSIPQTPVAGIQTTHHQSVVIPTSFSTATQVQNPNPGMQIIIIQPPVQPGTFYPTTSSHAQNGQSSKYKPILPKSTTASMATVANTFTGNSCGTQMSSGRKKQRNKQTPQENAQELQQTINRISIEDLKKVDPDGDTCLHSVIYKKNEQVVVAMLERLWRDRLQEIVDKQNKKGRTPLYVATVLNEPNLVAALVRFGADANAFAQTISSDGKLECKAAIHVAASRGLEYHRTLLEVLKARYISINNVNSCGQTALHCAVLVHGKQLDKDGKVRADSREIIKALIKAGADPCAQDKSTGKTPLMNAIEMKRCDLVETILRAVDPDMVVKVVKAQDFDGKSCINIAENLKGSSGVEVWNRMNNLLQAGLNGSIGFV